MNPGKAFRIVPLLGLVLLALWSGAGTAAAHAVLVGSDPAYGAMLEHAPERLSVSFDEPVTAAADAISVLDSEGRRADGGGLSTADGGRTLLVPLRSGLSNGTYLLGWSLLSADGHLVSGSIVFGIGVPPDLSVSTPPPDPLRAALDTVVRLLTGLGYAGLALGVGIPVAARLVWPPGGRTLVARQLTWVGAATMAVTALLIFAATPGRLAGATGWSDPRVWSQSVATVIGAAAVVRFAASWALLIGGSRSAGRGAIREVDGETGTVGAVSPHRMVLGARVRERLFGVGAIVAVAATAVSGHAVSGEFRWLALVSTIAHLLAMAVWVGGVVLVLLAWRTDARLRVVRAFGPVAAAAVAVVVVSGVVQSWRAVYPLAALWHTSWGLLLLAKVGLVVVALGTAVAMRRVAGGDGGSRLVRTEFGIQIAVLIVSALLTGVAPARDTYNPAATLQARLGPLTAVVDVDGTQVGRQEFTVRLRDQAGTPVTVLEVTGQLSTGDDASVPIEVPFRRVEPVGLGPDYFVSQSVRVPAPGQWRLRLTVVASRVDGYAATLRYRVW
ncbi:copper resistance protein CopC [Nocardia sp. NPDC052001]|uniref:copper resistance CopC/CopD family protein n=1 Tax=Nocardia sp. NPDC052001 TaxID=3154853 RepID=UPI00341D2B41